MFGFIYNLLKNSTISLIFFWISSWILSLIKELANVIKFKIPRSLYWIISKYLISIAKFSIFWDVSKMLWNILLIKSEFIIWILILHKSQKTEHNKGVTYLIFLDKCLLWLVLISIWHIYFNNININFCNPVSFHKICFFVSRVDINFNISRKSKISYSILHFLEHIAWRHDIVLFV